MSDAVAHMEVKHKGLITLSIMLATIMQVLDTTIANVALPSMQGNLGAAQDTITWVLTSYIVASAIMMPMTGWLSDHMGRNRLFLACVGGFTLASMLCGLATSLTEMVFFRLLQGLFGAGLAPLSQAVLLDINPRERHGQAMAMWGAGIMVAPVLGPTLGGWLTDSFDWRWVFYINLPVGILAFLGIAIYMPPAPRRQRPFDFFGFAMLSLFIGGLQLMLDRGEQLDWFSSGEVMVEAAVAVSALWCFVIHSMTTEHPFLHPQLFTDRNFVAGCVFTFAIGIVLLATTALLPPILQNILGYPTELTGLVLAPRGVGTMLSMLAVGRLMRSVDARLLILIGLLLTAWSLYDMTGFSTEMDSWPVIKTGLIQGLGLGLVFVPMSTIGFATLPGQFRTEGTALYSLVRSIGSSIGISVVSTLLSQNTQVNHAELAERITPFTPGLDQMAAALKMPVTSQAFESVLNQYVNGQAIMIAFIDDFKLMMFVTLVSVPLLVLLRKPKVVPRQAPPPDAH
ncbi:DHA2 family efflux MFS transporter permease subunit [Oryzibacter oryziterrae]|uniref:DHA2 family efflux MFS transporter permease subunit n=1 Tax=Oryzibacter oryziterrae TaxID=2766474 RepID=UPI001EFF779A|nr:DHA2 family efflux MFS transporter permease subunit [Oryzibacter oryziterrae]